MGGCRCTYRDCTVRSDGKTHFFHYPVFDKLRCHQWLTTAQRLDFLRLKVSQLKNRVICQYHFKDEMFMNFKKEKLTYTAVPTEPGPYCSPVDSADVKFEDEILSPIKPEYIENELLNINVEKRAKFSVKYGDFLTNCEVMELDSTDQLKTNNANFNSRPKSLKPILRNKVEENTITGEISELHHLQPTSNNNQQESNSKISSNPSNDFFQIEPIRTTTDNQNTYIEVEVLPPSDMNKNSDSRKPKITIISEEKYTKPLPAIKSLIPVSPSIILHPTEKNNFNDEKQHYYLQIENPVRTDTVAMQENQDLIPEDITTDYSKTECSEKNTAGKEYEKMEMEVSYVQKDTKKTPASKVTKLSNERVAAIQKKRNFNKRLKDIVSNSLNKLDEHDNLYNNLVDLKNKNVASHLTTETKLPNMENYLVKYLDARMNRMENTLLNRIDTNSHHISQLMNTLYNEKEEKSKKAETRSVSTQTTLDIKSHKRKVYDEISQYLSLETKSKIFEELFINNFL